MADKVLNFDIKINGKQIDITKMSMKDFDKVVKEAKKDLKDLPLNDPRYKVLSSEIKNADKTWKEWRKSIGEASDELEDGQEKVQSYKTQIRELELELIKAEKQFGKNSKEAADLRTKIAALRDEQDNLKNTTRDLDDSLSALPGPIGKVGQAMGAFEQISRNAKSAVGQLIQQFPILKNAIVASGIGALVIAFGLIVAAVMKAAKSFQPLQDAFAVLGDAVESLYQNIKPLAEFFLKVFVGAIEIVAKSINGLISVFGGISSTMNQELNAIDKQTKRLGYQLETQSNLMTENHKRRLEDEKTYLEKRKKIIEDFQNGEIKSVEERDKLLNALLVDNEIVTAKRKAEFAEKEITLINETNRRKELASAELIKNEQVREQEIERINNYYDKQNRLNRIFSQKKIIDEYKKYSQEVKSLDKETAVELIKQLNKLIAQAELEINAVIQENAAANEVRNRLIRKNIEERVRLLNQDKLLTKQALSEQLKDQEAAQLQQAYLAVESLKEQHRQELFEIETRYTESSEIYKSAQKRQAEQIKAANEKLRKETINYDAYIIQQEIDKQNRLAVEAGVGTKEYFDARREIINKEFEQELLLADNNENKIRNARNKFWKATLELDKEGLQAQINQLQKEYEGQYDNSINFFQLQRELEEKNYELQQKEYQNNFDMLDAIKAEHDKKMKMIDVAELEYMSNLLQRKADTELKTIKKQFDDRRAAEDVAYQARKKAAGDNVKELEQIEREHNQNIRQLNNEKIQSYAAVATATIDAFANVTNALASLNEMIMNDERKTMAERKKAFEKNKTYQIATASLSAASGIIQILAQPSTLPSPFDWIVKVANAAALGIMTAVQISKIKAQTFESAAGASTGGGSNLLGRNYEEGGLIGGRRHAQGGTIIEAEQGEAIMTRGAVSAFLPMLSMMNQMGGGASFLPNVGGASYDAPETSKPNEVPIIVKSYVVSKDMQTEMEKQNRLKDLSTL